MDYFAFKQKHQQEGEEEEGKRRPRIFIHSDEKSPARPTCIRYSASLFTPEEENDDTSTTLSTSLPSPPSTPQIPIILPSLSLPTNLLSFDNTRKRRFSNPPCRRRLHVLIVDDNFINLQILSRLLNMHLNQYIEHIELVKSGIKALEVLKCRPFDIIMMDIEMPILNGIETTQHIRSSTEFDILPTNRKIPIVAVTTNSSTSWRQTYNEIGMNGCIGKPISTIELKKTLAKVLELPSLIFPSTPE